jgi:shikimate 5-dehydrogenase
VGALVGGQRRALLQATREQFEDLTTEASLSGELSCIYKEEGQLVGHTTRPDAAGRALAQLLGPGYWLRHGAQLLCLGAGGAALPLLTYFATRAPAGDRPQRLVLTSQDIEQLHMVEQLLQRLSVAGVSVQLFHTSPAGNDQLLAELPDHSVVVNATPAGPNAAQSPLTPAARFPQHGAAWDMSNTGDSPFLQLARTQANERPLRLQNAALFHKLAWQTGVGYVLGVEVDGKQ